MDTINYYRVEIIVKKGLLYEEGNRFYSDKIPVLAENQDRYCLNNNAFTTIDKKARDYSTSLNKPEISSSVNDSCYRGGTGIRYTLYSDKDVTKSKIKGHIEKYIRNRFGAFFDISLDFLA